MLEINSSPLDSKPGHAYQTLRCTHSVVVPNELCRSVGREVNHDQLNQGFLGAGLAEGYCVLCVGASVEGEVHWVVPSRRLSRYRTSVLITILSLPVLSLVHLLC